MTAGSAGTGGAPEAGSSVTIAFFGTIPVTSELVAAGAGAAAGVDAGEPHAGATTRIKTGNAYRMCMFRSDRARQTRMVAWALARDGTHLDAGGCVARR